LEQITRLQSPFKCPVRMEQGVTAVALEPAYWNQVRLIALERRCTIEALVSEINHKGRLLPFQGLKYRRVLSLSAAIRLFVLQDVLAKLEKANERANRLAEAERRSSHHSPGRERLSHFPPGGPPPPRAGAAHETSGRRETEVVGSARRSYTPQGPSSLQSQLTRGCVVSTLRRCSARRFADGIEDGIVYRQAQR
jgi:predicted DNA-binding ribbon-helix-helix protein